MNESILMQTGTTGPHRATGWNGQL